MFKYLFVGGHFGDNPKKSGYIQKLYNNLQAINPNGTLINGGKFEELELHINRTFVGGKANATIPNSFLDVIFWMPDVSNDKKKLVGIIKKRCPHVILITSKNNLEEKYKFPEMVARALQVKANLFLEFTYNTDDHSERRIRTGIYDPLGNCFCRTSDVSRVAVILMGRIHQLLKFTRVGSENHGCVSMEVEPDAPDDFYIRIKDYADVFHRCIHGANPSRLLGNASFRCESGFPSFKKGNVFFVSRRNIDKRYIKPGGFVPVRLEFYNCEPNMVVVYDGEHKPSVDTPIQLLLYHYYHKMNYMIHSHTYIKYVPFTRDIIPCGAIEEYYEIISHCPEREHSLIKINLKGHGSLVMAQDIKNLKDIDYVPRITPEFVNGFE